MKNRVLSFVLAMVMMLSLSQVVFAKGLPFTDVAEGAWYYNDVKNAYEGGLINGKSAASFAPDDNLTYAEAVKLAACMYKKSMTGNTDFEASSPWYQAYVDYAKSAGIIEKDYSWTSPATRAGYMEIFAKAIPDTPTIEGITPLVEINNVPDDSIPDVKMRHPQAGAIYKLYRAGILTGSDEAHSCKPGNNIKRSEVAAILTRMMDADERIEFNMGTEETKPETETLVIVTQPESKTGTVGTAITTSVEATGGKEPYTYQWYTVGRGGSDKELTSREGYSGVETATLSYNPDSEGSETVWCIVTDADGNSVNSDKVELSATSPPTSTATRPSTSTSTSTATRPSTSTALKVSSEPADVTVYGGEVAVLEVAATGGTAPYKYEWYRYNGENNAPRKMSESGEVCLGTMGDTFSYFTPETSASYTLHRFYCEITDANGNKVTSRTAVVKAMATPIGITAQPVGGFTVTPKTAGYDKYVSVQVSGGTEPYTYQWYTDNKFFGEIEITGDLFYNEERNSYYECYRGTNTPTMYFVQSWAKLSGDYWCVITDAKGNKVETNHVYVTFTD